ncbi:hypothetical protein T440DRAFT_470524 [Plenodomus tracheiphilus IPT5]|uniref:Uncharacterized protein n=1 Tax=Plenodomus tracheiphilus IPT5 TaxID=1408161 RepID=A0A6A7AY25_9PLEO|nr:hypothetical protein T440DRAFT_470524 [Plenodomus tracheiphilus IPT5]
MPHRKSSLSDAEEMSQLRAEASIFIPSNKMPKEDDGYCLQLEGTFPDNNTAVPLPPTPLEKHSIGVKTAKQASRSPSDPSPSLQNRCDNMHQFFIKKPPKTDDTIEVLRQRLEQHDRETADANYNKLHVEKNGKIKQLREGIAKVKQEEQELRTDVEERGKILKALELEIRKLQPVQFFVVKEQKGKKR